jgi:hypothetical protein
MVPVDSVGIPRGPTYSGTSREIVECRLRDCHPLWSVIPSRSATRQFCDSHVRGPTTPQGKPPRFGLFRFRSPLLTKSIFLSLPPGTEMFQFPGLAAPQLWIHCGLIRESRDHHLFVSSPEHFADFHALHRLLMPRHPPCALRSLTTFI